MMDKRSLLAIGLCILLAYVYPKIITKYFPEAYAPKTQPLQNEVVVKKTTDSFSEQSNPAYQKSIEKPIVIPQTFSVKQEDIVFETDIYKVTFSNYGGSIKEMIFKKMKDGVEPQTIIDDLDAKWRPFAINKLGNFGDMSAVPFTVAKENDRAIFSYLVDGKFVIKKEFIFRDGSYLIDVNFSLENVSQDKLDILGVNDKLDINCGTLIRVGKEEKVSYLGVDGFIGKDAKVLSLNTKNIGNVDKADALIDSLKNKLVKWVGVRNKRYALLLINKGFETPMWANKYIPLDSTLLVEGYTAVTQLEGTLSLKEGEIFTREFSFYAGPKYLSYLDTLGNDCDRILDLGWFWFISRIMIYVLTFLYSVVKNYGVAIIVLTIGTKIILHPLTQKSFKSMNRMKELQPELNELKEKYKDNPKKMQTETMGLYKKHGVNPLGGCLPMVLQMPVFFALFNTINNFVELQGASFLWVKDLSIPDTVGQIAGLPINPLPLIMGLTTYWQQKMSTVDPNQQKMMMFMPVFLTFIFYNFSSGLVIYWLVNNLLTIGQQYLTTKKEVQR